MRGTLRGLSERDQSKNSCTRGWRTTFSPSSGCVKSPAIPMSLQIGSYPIFNPILTAANHTSFGNSRPVSRPASRLNRGGSSALRARVQGRASPARRSFQDQFSVRSKASRLQVALATKLVLPRCRGTVTTRSGVLGPGLSLPGCRNATRCPPTEARIALVQRVCGAPTVPFVEIAARSSANSSARSAREIVSSAPSSGWQCNRSSGNGASPVKPSDRQPSCGWKMKNQDIGIILSFSCRLDNGSLSGCVSGCGNAVNTPGLHVGGAVSLTLMSLLRDASSCPTA